MSTADSLTERWIWMALSLCVALLAILVQALLHRQGRRVDFIYAPWVAQPLRLIYAVGIPAAALIWRGVLTERGLGLQPLLALSDAVDPQAAAANWTNWMQDLGWTVVLTALAWIVFALGDRSAQRAGGAVAARRRRDGAIALREAVYHQVHWAFYREPFVLLWGPALGAWLGLLPVAFEAALNPHRWADLRSPLRGRDLLLRIELAILALLIYVQTQNLWLAILADAALLLAVGQTEESSRGQP